MYLVGPFTKHLLLQKKKRLHFVIYYYYLRPTICTWINHKLSHFVERNRDIVIQKVTVFDLYLLSNMYSPYVLGSFTKCPLLQREKETLSYRRWLFLIYAYYLICIHLCIRIIHKLTHFVERKRDIVIQKVNLCDLLSPICTWSNHKPSAFLLSFSHFTLSLFLGGKETSYQKYLDIKKGALFLFDFFFFLCFLRMLEKKRKDNNIVTQNVTLFDSSYIKFSVQKIYFRKLLKKCTNSLYES